MNATVTSSYSKFLNTCSHCNLRDFWDNIKCTKVQIIGISEEQEINKWYEKIYEEIILKNFLNMGKGIATQV